MAYGQDDAYKVGSIPDWIDGPSNPSYSGFDFDDSGAINDLYDVADDAVGGTITNFNRAANRLRERTDAMTNSSQENYINDFLGRGIGAGGGTGAGLRQISRDGQQAFGEGLVGIENAFEGHRQTGLNTAQQALATISGEHTSGQQMEADSLLGIQGLQSDDFAAMLQDNQFMNDLLERMREGRAADRREGWTTSQNREAAKYSADAGQDSFSM